MCWGAHRQSIRGIQINDEILTGESVEKYVTEDDTVHAGSIILEPGSVLDLKTMTTTSTGAAEYPVVLLQASQWARHDCGVTHTHTHTHTHARTHTNVLTKSVKQALCRQHVAWLRTRTGAADCQGLCAHAHDGRAEGMIERQGRIRHATPVDAVGARGAGELVLFLVPHNKTLFGLRFASFFANSWRRFHDVLSRLSNYLYLVWCGA